MKHSEIKLRSLKTLSDCMDAIESIHSDHRNHYGTHKEWRSGGKVYLTDTAEKKIAAINSRADRLSPADPEDE